MDRHSKILVVNHEFWPETSGSLTCLENIVKKLSEQYVVDVVCARTDIDTESNETKFGCEINRVGTVYDLPFLINKQMQKNENMFSLMSKIFSYPIRKMLRKKSVFWGFDDAYEGTLKKYLEENISSYDYIVTMVFPKYDTDIVAKIKEAYPNIKWIILQFDMYAYNPAWPDSSNSDRVIEQMRWYDYADRIVIQNEMNNALFKSVFSIYESKIVPLHIPSLDCIDFESKQDNIGFLDRICKAKDINKNGIISVVYTGRFYADIRNPEYMLKCFERILSKDNDIYLFILGFGCEEQIKKYKHLLGDRLVVCGNTSYEESVSAQRGANILLNISNSYREMVPSKILEYIGRRKPILNFYSIEDDICEEYLLDYPIRFSVDERINISSEIIDDINSFILTNADTICDFSEVNHKYKRFTTEYFVKKMMEDI